jgi:DNA-binding response OmpR family regulator
MQAEGSAITPPPRILLVMRDQWPRALLRAALREVGYDAIGTRSLGVARYQAGSQAGRGPVRLVVLDQEVLTEEGEGQLEDLGRTSAAPIVLLAPAMRRAREGPWVRVFRRPLSIGDLVQAIAALVPLPPEARKPIDQ